MKEGDNQRDQVQVWASLTQGSCTPLKLRWTWQSTQPLSLSLRFSPSCSLFPYPYPHPVGGVGGTHKTTWTLYILSMQGRLTLHVRILVHISQVSSVFLKSQCQCSCTDILTKILTTCRCGKCFRRCWRYILMYSFNNRFIDRLTAGYACGQFVENVFCLKCFCCIIHLRLW